MWKYQEMFIEKYGLDAMLHYGYGGWITALGFPFGLMVTLCVFVGMVILALFKEFVLDGGYDKIDFLWSVYGGLTSVVIMSIITLIP